MKDGAWSYTTIKVLEFLVGRQYDEIAKAYIRALRPSAVRVTDGGVKCDSKTWRVTVILDRETKAIWEISQEVEVDLPDGIDNGWELDCALKAGTA